MSIEKVRAYLDQFSAADRIIELNESSATVPLAAAALGVEEARIAKTLSFMVDGHATLVVFAGDARINNSAFKAQFHTKAKMLTPEQAVGLVGHAPGGVCPFAVNEGTEVWLDESLKRFETVFPACGSSNSAIELTPDELEEFSHPMGWVNVGKLPE